MTAMTAEAYRGVLERAELLIPAAQVEEALAEMARQITARVGEHDPLVLCVMTGGIVTTGLLLPQLEFPLRLDYVHATRYHNTTRGGTLEWRHRPSRAVAGATVLVIDDIFDEGTTLEYIVRACYEDGARAVCSAVLVEKDRPRACTYRPDVVGLMAPNRYLIGYGLDYRGYLRNIRGIYAIAAEDI